MCTKNRVPLRYTVLAIARYGERQFLIVTVKRATLEERDREGGRLRRLYGERADVVGDIGVHSRAVCDLPSAKVPE